MLGEGYLFAGPYDRECSIWGFILGSPSFGKLPLALRSLSEAYVLGLGFTVKQDVHFYMKPWKPHSVHTPFCAGLHPQESRSNAPLVLGLGFRVYSYLLLPLLFAFLSLGLIKPRNCF